LNPWSEKTKTKKRQEHATGRGEPTGLYGRGTVNQRKIHSTKIGRARNLGEKKTRGGSARTPRCAGTEGVSGSQKMVLRTISPFEEWEKKGVGNEQTDAEKKNHKEWKAAGLSSVTTGALMKGEKKMEKNTEHSQMLKRRLQS